MHLVAMLLSACSGSTPPAARPGPAEAARPATATPEPASSPRDAASASSTCAEQTARLGTQLRELAAAQPGFLPLLPSIKAPVTSTARPVDTRGVVVAVTRDGKLFIQGYELASTRDLRDYLEQVHRTALEKTVMGGGTAADATLPLYVWADAATPVRAVASVAAALEPEPAKPKPKPKLTPEQERVRKQAIEQARAAGILGTGPGTNPPAFTVRLIVTSPDSVSPPAPSLPGASDPEATRLLVDQLKTAIGTCEPILTALATVSLEGVPAKEAEKLVTGIPAGLGSCECKVGNLDALTSGLRTWFGAWAPSLRWIELPKLAATDQRPIGQLVAK